MGVRVGADGRNEQRGFRQGESRREIKGYSESKKKEQE